MSNFNSPNERPLGFLRLKQVLKLIPVSKVTWWNGCKTGIYPRPYKLGPRITAWKTSDIYELMEKFKVSSNNGL